MNKILKDRLSLFPDTAVVENNLLTIAECDLVALAEKFGTPLYLYDRATMDASAGLYRSLLGKYYPAASSITYAGKAYLPVLIAKWAVEQGLDVDCTGLGEVHIAVKAGVSGDRLIIHGVNKSPEDLDAAVKFAQTIVVDNLSELRRLDRISAKWNLPDLWLRLQPGMAVETHAYTQTGHEDSKFGMDYSHLLEAARFCRENNLPLKGIHFHQGSQFRDPEPLGQGLDRALDAAQRIGFTKGWHLSPGGGWGVAYHEDDLPQPSIERYVRFIAEMVQTGCRTRNLPLPHIHLEPGRSLIARAGVALYRVGTIKKTAQRTWLLVDGGMADNPRVALYGTKYSALPVQSPEKEYDEKVWIAGPYCESGDVLIENLPFPRIEEGELIAVPVSGAYQLSMSSNYNGARKPASLMLARGAEVLIQSRELPEDLFRRDPS